MDTHDRLRLARQRLSLTQDYVASLLNLPRTAVVQIESGKRKLASSELESLCRIYGISADYALGISSDSERTKMYARSIEALPDEDQMEIMNLIEFKKKLARKREAAEHGCHRS